MGTRDKGSELDRSSGKMKIVEGSGNKSYGIQVAKMAGLPKIVIQRASQILAHHLNDNLNEKNTNPNAATYTIKLNDNSIDLIRKFRLTD